MPKLSFVIPVYNKQAFIAECLQSICSQTEKDIEAVVVDDCSTDDSLEIAKWFADKDKRIKLFKLPNNSGRSHARNFGNSKVSSNIICVQDADDLAIAERADITYKYFKRNKVDAFYGSFFVGDAYGRISEEVKARKFDIETTKKDGFTYIGHSTMAYRSEVARKIPYCDGEWAKLGLDDFKLQIDLYKKGYKFGFTDKHLMIYRQMSNSISVVRNDKSVKKLKDSYLKSI